MSRALCASRRARDGAGSASQTTQTATALRADVEGRVATTTSTPSSPVMALPDLARGATGEPVRVLQDHLVKAGLMTQAEVDTGPGVFGPRTARALSQLQASQGLPVTGRLDGGTRRAGTQNAWNSWCLAFVSTAYGRQVPELQAPDAITSSRKFEAAGKLHESTANIPAGAPVFFAATPSNGQFGHIALATGRTDPATGEPLIRSTGWNGKPGIFEAPLSYFTRTTGPWIGWGDVGAR